MRKKAKDAGIQVKAFNVPIPVAAKSRAIP
jgi:hypothetical protein